MAGKPTSGGLLAALIFWWFALTPSLVPRAWPSQAAINAVALAIGYGIGTLAGRRLGSFRPGWPGAPLRIVRILVGIGWLMGIALGPALWMGWQNDQRRFMGMDEVDGLDAALMVAVSAAGVSLLLLMGYAIGRIVLAVIRYSRRRLPEVRSAPAIGLAALLLGVVAAGWIAWQGIVASANTVYAEANASTDEGTLPPDSPSVSGSPESLVAWDTLGRWGRNFVASATTTRELQEFHGEDAVLSVPVRTYVGLDSAGSMASRAELAVRELERAGGFDREVLVVWVPTGTGWMIPEAARAIEQLHRGDTAIVGMQYSFLPSLLSVFMDPGLPIDAASTLFDAVHARWSTLPSDRRPKLVLFSKSLGTAGIEAAFVEADAASSVARLTAQTDGALIVGPKHTNPIHSQLTRERDAGSPVWQPIFDGGRTVRYLNRDPHQSALDPQWPSPRIVYLQHPSDPVPFWGIDALWRPPEWMDRPRGFDVPEAATWFPLVSALHATVDLIFQLSTPPGFGHVYATEYVKGWANLLPPDGWTEADTEQLQDFLGEGEDEPEFIGEVGLMAEAPPRRKL
jgi:uncharacterized membrane protein